MFARKVTDCSINQWLPSTIIQCYTPEEGLQPFNWPLSVIMHKYKYLSSQAGTKLWSEAIVKARKIQVALVSDGFFDVFPALAKFAAGGFIYHVCCFRDDHRRVSGVRVPRMIV